MIIKAIAKIKNHGFIIFIALLQLLVYGLRETNAQYCPGSRTLYIVRDEKGKIINPAKLKDLILKIERDPREVKNEYESLMKQGDEHYKAQRYKEALEFFKMAARLKPEESKAHFSVVDTYAALKLAGEAVLWYRQAVLAKPESPVLQTVLGYAFEQVGKHEDALKHFKEAARLAPTVAIYRYNYGSKLGFLGRSEEAIMELQEAVRLDPKLVDAHTVLGMEYQTLGRYEESIKHLSEALRLNPTEEYALHSRAPMFLALNRGREVAADAEKFLAAHGWKNQQSIYMALFGALGYRVNNQEAEAQKLLNLASQNVDRTRWAAPAIEYLLGRLSEKELLKLAANDKDKMTEARGYIGMNLLLSGKRKEALQHLRWMVEKGNKSFHEYRFAKAALESVR